MRGAAGGLSISGQHLDGPQLAAPAHRTRLEPCPICTKEMPRLKAALQTEKRLRVEAQARAEALAKKLAALQRKLEAAAAGQDSAQDLQAKIDTLQQEGTLAKQKHAAALKQATADTKQAKAALQEASAAAAKSGAAAASSNAKVVALQADLHNAQANTQLLQEQVHGAQVALAAAQGAPPAGSGDDLREQLEATLRQRDEANVQLVHTKKDLAVKVTECDALREDFSVFRERMAEFRSAATEAVSMHQDMAQAVARAAGGAKQAAAREALVNMMRVCVVAPQVTLRLTQSRTVNHFAGGDATGGRGASDTHITEESVTTKAPLSAAMVNLQSTISKDIMPRFAVVYSKVMKAADAALSRTPYSVATGGSSSGQGSEALFKSVSDEGESKMLSDLCDRMASAVRKIIAKEFDDSVVVHTNSDPGQLRG